ncbi:MAG: aminotransferase class I/II-fold pyridoxal phosphate-dependent enzyme [Tannerellaceae bacterium]|jgi:methionine-gamma-lyase|nr:aminotransferase class I/II-fold pyridoxal phosphate-dependent enzyme [Tannerellaceae bacterium]
MDKGFSSRLIHLGERFGESVSRSKSIPIAMTSVFSFDDVESLDRVYEGLDKGYIYTRNGNPVHDALADIMSGIEEGEAALAYASGMGAISLSILAHVRAGDHVIAAWALYGGSFQFIRSELARFDISVTFVDPLKDDLSAAFRSNTRLLYVETISNPTMEVVDLEVLAQVAHSHGAKLIVDNSFATPVICRPLLSGADVVVYSATKYIGGHSDVTAGIVVSDRETINRIYASGLLFGPTLSPFDGWLLIRSLRTLELRIKQHSQNAGKLADYFATHPSIRTVYYPGLADSPTHAIAKRIFNNDLYGGMLSIDLDGGEPQARALLRTLETIKFVPSLAGVSTTTSYPAKTSHRALNDEELAKVGISKGLIRVSVGLEDADDIVAEFDAALNKIY